MKSLADPGKYADCREGLRNLPSPYISFAVLYIYIEYAFIYIKRLSPYICRSNRELTKDRKWTILRAIFEYHQAASMGTFRLFFVG